MHGAPLGGAEVLATREALGWAHAPFDVPADVYDAWDAKANGQALERAWTALFAPTPNATRMRPANSAAA